MVFNSLLNFILKAIIKQPRPKGDLNLNGKKHSPRILSDVYGMPSGHAQGVVLSTVYIYSVLKNVEITTFYILLSLLTMSQRVIYKNHTISQVLVGAFVGAFIGYFACQTALLQRGHFDIFA